MSKQDRPHKGSSGNAEPRSGPPGTSGGSEAAQCLSVAESAHPAPDLDGIRERLARWEALIAEQDRRDASDPDEEVPPALRYAAWRLEEAITDAMLDLAHDVKPLMWANAQLTAERDRACDLAAALEAELAATRTTRTPSWCLHGDTYRHCPTTPTHPNAE